MTAASVKPRRFLTVAEVASELRESPSAVYTKIRLGAFPHTRLGGRVVVERQALDAWISARSISVEQALAAQA